jgi:DNA-binding CsgD family transcriptional regulator
MIVERAGKHLAIRLVEGSDHSLLIMEEQRALTPESLKPLGLSLREAQVLHWIVQGKTDADIGAILGLSPRTVQKHLEHIYQKLGVENRTAATAKVCEFTPITNGWKKPAAIRRTEEGR